MEQDEVEQEDEYTPEILDFIPEISEEGVGLRGFDF